MTTYEIEIVALPAQALVCLRERGPVTEMGRRAQQLSALLATAGLKPAGPLQARFHDQPVDPRDTDFEVCLPIALDDTGWVPDAVGEAAVALTPAHHALATTHRGAHEDIAQAHQALRTELAVVGYHACGPATETYVDGLPGETPTADRVTVVSLPYAR